MLITNIIVFRSINLKNKSPTLYKQTSVCSPINISSTAKRSMWKVIRGDCSKDHLLRSMNNFPNVYSQINLRNYAGEYKAYKWKIASHLSPPLTTSPTIAIFFDTLAKRDPAFVSLNCSIKAFQAMAENNEFTHDTIINTARFAIYRQIFLTEKP
jgi:hypothetical protein